MADELKTMDVEPERELKRIKPEYIEKYLPRKAD